jgi:hypothetical protein
LNVPYWLKSCKAHAGRLYVAPEAAAAAAAAAIRCRIRQALMPMAQGREGLQGQLTPDFARTAQRCFMAQQWVQGERRSISGSAEKPAESL